MHIASRLRDTTLGDLLASLHRTGASGVLELIEPHERHAIHLRRGMVQAVESNAHATRLGDVAMRIHGLPRTLVERARMFAHTRGVRLGQALVATQVIRPHDLDGLLAAQQRERLDRLYHVPDAELRFHVARSLPPGSSEQSPLHARDAFYGRPRSRPRLRASQQTTRAKETVATASAARIRESLAALGLGADAGAKDVRTAYRRLVFELHPDRAGDATAPERDGRAQKLVAVLEAYKRWERATSAFAAAAATG